jgi:hypothetical protein
VGRRPPAVIPTVADIRDTVGPITVADGILTYFAPAAAELLRS